MHPVVQLEDGFVAAMHNDLVLCRAELGYIRHYYICNPCTKQYVALPPAPQAYFFVGEGFICDPYYTYSSSTSTSSSSTIHINDDYRWMVVRINPDFDIEIFSSKTGEWRKLVLRLIRGDNDNYRLVNFLGTPWKGKLYWLGENKWKKYDDVDIYEVKERRRFPFTLELDPFSASAYPSGHIIDKYRIIEGPLMDNRELTNLFVSHGCLWACTAINVEVDELAIWQLKEDQEVDGEEVVGGRKWWYLMHKLLRYETFLNSKDPLIAKSTDIMINSTRVLGLHPNNEDIMYLAVVGLGIVMCNLGTKELEFVAQLPDEYERAFRMHATFVLPLWPTPIPKLPFRS
jgi:hypothetical protein